MGIKQLYNDNLRKLPNEYGDVSVMHSLSAGTSKGISVIPVICYFCLFVNTCISASYIVARRHYRMTSSKPKSYNGNMRGFQVIAQHIDRCGRSLQNVKILYDTFTVDSSLIYIGVNDRID